MCEHPLNEYTNTALAGIAALRASYRQRAWHGLSVFLLVTSVSRAKTAAGIEMPFELWTRVGPRNDVLGGGPDPPRKGALLADMYPTPFWATDASSLRAGRMQSIGTGSVMMLRCRRRLP